MSTYKILSRKQGQYQFQRGMPLKSKERNMVKFSFDPSNLTELTAQQKAELAALKNIPDSAIDYTDIPELDEDFWANSRRPAQENKK